MNRARGLGVCIVAAMMCSCDPIPPAAKPSVTDAEREENRRSLYQSMITEEGCYLNSLDYAVRDREFLDRVLTRLLTGKNLDAMILSDKTYGSAGPTYEIARMMRDAPQAYAAELRTPDGLARLEGLIADRFAHPAVEMQRGVVKVNYGHVAAKLALDDHKRIVVDFLNSVHLDARHQWRRKEVDVAITYQLEKHPNANGVELRILIPESGRNTTWRYEYLRANNLTSVYHSP